MIKSVEGLLSVSINLWSQFPLPISKSMCFVCIYHSIIMRSNNSQLHILPKNDKPSLHVRPAFSLTNPDSLSGLLNASYITPLIAVVRIFRLLITFSNYRNHQSNFSEENYAREKEGAKHQEKEIWQNYDREERKIGKHLSMNKIL